MMTEEDYKFIIGGLIEYISEFTDFWDNHEDIGDMYPSIADWSAKLKIGIGSNPLPPKTPCTCPHDWAKDRMKTVEDLLYCLKVNYNA